MYGYTLVGELGGDGEGDRWLGVDGGHIGGDGEGDGWLGVDGGHTSDLILPLLSSL